MPWNTARKHKRKFLQAHGAFADGDRLVDDDIHFWGEWEPQSVVIKKFAHPLVDRPKCLHRPSWRAPFSYGRKALQNTDPFVFGERFHYTVCQQYKRRRKESEERFPTRLRDLPDGSIILFGSRKGYCKDPSKDHSRFVLDTVFVVRNSVLYDHTDIRERILPKVDPTYAGVTLSPLYGRNIFEKGPTRESLKLRLYDGVSYAEKKNADGMFSFFPCISSSSSESGFPRPTISINELVSEDSVRSKANRKNQGFSVRRNLDQSELARIWRSIVCQVEEQGCKVGVFANMPPQGENDADGFDQTVGDPILLDRWGREQGISRLNVIG